MPDMVNVIDEYCERKRNKERDNKLLEIATQKFKGDLVAKIGTKINIGVDSSIAEIDLEEYYADLFIEEYFDATYSLLEKYEKFTQGTWELKTQYPIKAFL